MNGCRSVLGSTYGKKLHNKRARNSVVQHNEQPAGKLFSIVAYFNKINCSVLTILSRYRNETKNGTLMWRTSQLDWCSVIRRNREGSSGKPDVHPPTTAAGPSAGSYIPNLIRGWADRMADNSCSRTGLHSDHSRQQKQPPQQQAAVKTVSGPSFVMSGKSEPVPKASGEPFALAAMVRTEAQ